MTSAVDGSVQVDELGSLVPPDMELVGVLGRGVQSVVYRVRRDGSDYALKTSLSPVADLPEPHPIQREAAILAWIDHPHFPEVYEVGTRHGRPYSIMELIEGSDLATLLRQGPLPADQAAEIGRQVADALDALHRVGILHRDVKPANIVRRPDGLIRLLDLGLSILGTSAEGGADGPVVGTLTYAAPEQSGTLKRPVDARSDLYALGGVLYECLTGHPPYEAEETGELLRRHASAPVPDPRRERPETPAGLAAVIVKMLAKDPDDRYQSAAGVAADLARAGREPALPWQPGGHDAPVDPNRALPLIGRDDELRALIAGWERARRGRGGLAVIHGATGTGKTRLTVEIAGRVRGDGAPVLAADCSTADLPLGALRAAVRAYVRLDRPPEGDGPGDEDRRGPAAAERLNDWLSAPSGTAAGVPDADPEVLVGLLADVARSQPGALLILDGAQHLDEATRNLLRHLALRLRDTPLLVVIAGSAPDRLGVPADVDIPLGDLGAADIRALVTRFSGRAADDGKLVERVLAHGARTPLEILEYLLAIFDAGLLTPHWGDWRLDTAGLDRLALPRDIIDLLTRRLTALTGPARKLLSAAALIGMRFALKPAATACAMADDEAVALLRQASEAGVLEAHDGVWAFTHECLRTALREALTEEDRRDLHAKITQVLAADLAADEATAPEMMYSLAQHCLAGRPERDPARSAGILLAAGNRALSDNAPMQAVTFFRPLAGLAETPDRGAGGRPSPVQAREALADALHAAGSFDESLENYELALRCARNPGDRFRILLAVANVYNTRWQVGPQRQYVDRALAEIGSHRPENRAWLLATSLGRFAAGLTVALTKVGSGSGRARHRRLAAAYGALGGAAIQGSDPVETVVATLRMLYPAARLGDSAEYAKALAQVHVLTTVLGLRRYSGMIRRAIAVAERLDDARLRSRMVWVSNGASVVAGRSDRNLLLLQQAREDRNLPLMEYVTSIVVNCSELLSRGHVDRAGQLCDTAKRRVAAADLHHPALILIDLARAAARGRLAETDRLLDRVIADPVYTVGMLRSHLLMVRAQVAVEQREFGDVFDSIASEVARQGTHLPAHTRPMWTAIAYGRIEQCLAAPAGSRPTALRLAEQTVANLGRVAAGADLRAHHRVARAYLAHLRGDHARSLDLLNRADADLRQSDTPLALYEASRLRARVLTALGLTDNALAQARAAASLAATHGWPHRIGWLRTEFRVPPDDGGPAPAGHDRTPTHSHSHNHAGYHLLKRKLAAIEQISLASSRVLDPAELTRIALDEVIRLLGADRAFLFLAEDTEFLAADDDAGPPGPPPLTPHLGRDSSGADIATLTDYGSTLVEMVRTGQEPIVVTGTDEGAALGSQSAVQYRLRSMLVAPMLLEGRLLGVVYLDSRIAKGMFANEDIGTLSAITNYVATALETARAAQLALAVRAAEELRDTSETIRTALTDLTASLDPWDVLTRLTASVATAIPADRCRLVVENDEVFHLYELSNGQAHLAARLITLDAETSELVHAPEPTAGGARGLTLLPGMRSWLAVPLRTRQGELGLILLGKAESDAFARSDLDLANMLAGQGMIVYDNARLFSQVKAMASTDELTGVPNRRRFFELARNKVAANSGQDNPLAALMVDIDHFKSVNDTHGHHVGDQVIRAVANRMASAIRDDDLLGRYGGEEFALLLHVVDDPRTLADRLLTVVSETPIPTDAGDLSVTVSVGVTQLRPADPGIEDLLSRADEALYRAKNAGRNRAMYA